jgi:hypothetical protein
MKPYSLVPNFYIHESLSDLYILTIGPRQTDGRNIYNTHSYTNVEIVRQNIIILYWR